MVCRNQILVYPATKIQAYWRGYNVRKYVKKALELSKSLRHFLIYRSKTINQDGMYLYPNPVIPNVETGAQLADL